MVSKGAQSHGALRSIRRSAAGTRCDPVDLMDCVQLRCHRKRVTPSMWPVYQAAAVARRRRANRDGEHARARAAV